MSSVFGPPLDINQLNSNTHYLQTVTNTTQALEVLDNQEFSTVTELNTTENDVINLQVALSNIKSSTIYHSFLGPALQTGLLLIDNSSQVWKVTGDIGTDTPTLLTTLSGLYNDLVYFNGNYFVCQQSDNTLQTSNTGDSWSSVVTGQSVSRVFVVNNKLIVSGQDEGLHFSYSSDGITFTQNSWSDDSVIGSFAYFPNTGKYYFTTDVKFLQINDLNDNSPISPPGYDNEFDPIGESSLVVTSNTKITVSLQAGQQTYSTDGLTWTVMNNNAFGGTFDAPQLQFNTPYAVIFETPSLFLCLNNYTNGRIWYVLKSTLDQYWIDASVTGGFETTGGFWSRTVGNLDYFVVVQSGFAMTEWSIDVTNGTLLQITSGNYGGDGCGRNAITGLYTPQIATAVDVTLNGPIVVPTYNVLETLQNLSLANDQLRVSGGTYLTVDQYNLNTPGYITLAGAESVFYTKVEQDVTDGNQQTAINNLDAVVFAMPSANTIYGGSGSTRTDLNANQVSTILDGATDPFVRTSAGPAPFIVDNTVTLAKLVKIPTLTLLGNSTGILADVTYLSADDTKSILDTATIPYITASALSPYLLSSTAASTYYTQANPSGYQTLSDVNGNSTLTNYTTTSSLASTYLTQSNAASTYYTQANPSGYQTLANVNGNSTLTNYTTTAAQNVVDGNQNTNITTNATNITNLTTNVGNGSAIVTNALLLNKFNQIPTQTVLGNNTGSTADVISLTASQLLTLIRTVQIPVATAYLSRANLSYVGNGSPDTTAWWSSASVSAGVWTTLDTWDGHNEVGSVSYSSGVWTLPNTGTYKINFVLGSCLLSGATQAQLEVGLNVNNTAPVANSGVIWFANETGATNNGSITMSITGNLIQSFTANDTIRFQWRGWRNASTILSVSVMNFYVQQLY